MEGLGLASWRSRLLVIAVGLAAVLAIGPPRSARATPAAPIHRVSVSSLGVPADRDSSGPSISGSGRFVAFSTASGNLVRGDTNDAADVFVRDLVTGRTRRVSVSANGSQLNGASGYAAISPSGKLVAFASQATNVVSGFSDSGHLWNLYVRDLVNRTTRVVSVDGSGSGVGFNDVWPGSSAPALSAQGRFIVFTDSAYLVERRDMTAPGAVVINSGYDPAVSGDGKRILFETPDELVPADTNGLGADAYLWDAASPGSFTLVSASSSGPALGDTDVYGTALSADGRFAVFIRRVPSGAQYHDQIFVRDLTAGTTREITRAPSGRQGNGGSRHPSISSLGRYIVFFSPASNLVSGDRNAHTDVFVRDTRTHRTRMVSRNLAGGPGNGSSNSPVISYNGAYCAFVSGATTLIPSDTNHVRDIFRAQLLP